VSADQPGSSCQPLATQRLLLLVLSVGGAGVTADVVGVEGRDAGSAGKGAGVRMGALEQATRLPTIAQPNHRHKRCCMTLILLEALGAGVLLVLIVWWTMFSGRDRGEPRRDPADAATPTPSHPVSGAPTTEQEASKTSPPKV